MPAYIARRVLYSVPVLLAASFAIFSFTILAGKPTDQLSLNPRTPKSVIRDLEVKHHLDRPITVQYWYWVEGAVRGDFGTTLFGERRILPEIERVLPHTAQLVLLSELIAVALALVIGVYSAVRQYSPFDYAATTASFIGFAMPVFWLGLLLQILFTDVYLKYGVRIFYTSSLSSSDAGHGLRFLVDRLQHLSLPVATLATLSIALHSRFLRASMLEVINADFVRTARAKGIRERRVVVRHALRNALIPLTTVVALNFGSLLGGAVVTETIFSLDGMGTYYINALGSGDPYPIAAWLMVAATMVIALNLVADVVLALLDPRIRLEG